MATSDYTPGRFVWRELMTPDIEGAKAFYGELFNWSFVDANMPTGTYLMIRAGDATVGGAMPMPTDAEHPPHWISYVSVPDVDEAARAAEANGGMVGVPPTDIPTVGRFAVLGDPSNAWITAFRHQSHDEVSQGPPRIGHFCWETLTTRDVDQAKAFYAAVFGWGVEAGPAGPDSVFNAEGVAVADVQPADNQPSAWTTYVVVSDIENACSRTESLGGNVLLPEHEIPTVGFIAVIADGDGASLGLFQSK